MGLISNGYSIRLQPPFTLTKPDDVYAGKNILNNFVFPQDSILRQTKVKWVHCYTILEKRQRIDVLVSTDVLIKARGKYDNTQLYITADMKFKHIIDHP